MKPADLRQDLSALEAELRAYEHHYGILTREFYEAYMDGDEASDPSWEPDRANWARLYEDWLRWQELQPASA
ncbi:MAG: hypothetical protein HZY76_15055 [Anaerolineae bacterium]|nr:MAG: hypothetical protein HZY76_15055 [Anaerolineae bacterium]